MAEASQAQLEEDPAASVVQCTALDHQLLPQILLPEDGNWRVQKTPFKVFLSFVSINLSG